MTDHAAEVETLREQVRQLTKALGGDLRWPLEWRLTPTETRLLGVLAKRERPTLETFTCALWSDRADDPPDPKTIDIHIMRVRRKLKPHGFTIHTEWGLGWHLSVADRARLRRIAEQQRQK